MQLPNLVNRLNGLGFNTTTSIKQALADAGKDASGALIQKTIFTLSENPSFISLQMKAPAHWKFVDEGRKPGKRPPFKKIKQWVRRKRLNLDGISEDGLAFIIARKIGRDGIEPTNIYSDAIKVAMGQINIGEFANQDITKSVSEVLNQK